jgi:metal-responsive CopG/Arc/MetJ family transcriptional regulator
MPRYTIDLSGQVLEDLDTFAKKHHISRAEAARRAFAILAIADKESEKGNELGIINTGKRGAKTTVVSRIAGV